ncbi:MULTISPECIES: hypothetical protein [unclassified Geodermatophilus]|uniref:hypothetical protein n=1 Tax=unclassified Geodermatophilus TaxID=2637632 RepID=UPI003EECC82D
MADLEDGRDTDLPTVPGNASGAPPADAAPGPETAERSEVGDWDRAWLPGWVTPTAADAGKEAVPGGTTPEREPAPAAEADLPAGAGAVDEGLLPRVVVGPRVRPRRRAGLALGIGLLAAGGIAGAAVLATSSPGAVAAADRHSADAEISVPTRAGSTPRSAGIGDAAWAAAPTVVPVPSPLPPRPEAPTPDPPPVETVPPAAVAAARPADEPPPGDVLPDPVTVPAEVPAPDAVAVAAPTALPTAEPTSPNTVTPVPTGTPTPTGTGDPADDTPGDPADDPTGDPAEDPQPTPTDTSPPTSVIPPTATDGQDPATPPPAAARPGPRA